MLHAWRLTGGVRGATWGAGTAAGRCCESAQNQPITIAGLYEKLL